MATLNLSLDPTAIMAGSARAEDALQNVTAAAVKTENALDDASKSSKGMANNSKMLAMQLSQVTDMGLATGQWGKAFFLQASDIAMVLGGPMAIAAGMAVGVIGTLGLSFLNASTSGATLEDQIDSLDERSRAMRGTLDLLTADANELWESFGDGAEQVKLATAAVADLQLAQLRQDLSELSTDLSGIGSEFVDVIDKSKGHLEALVTAQGLTVDEALALRDAFVEVQSAADMDSQVQAVDKLNALIKQTGLDLGVLPEEAQATLLQFLKLSNQVQEVEKTASDLEAATKSVGAAANQISFRNAAAEASDMADQVLRAVSAMYDLQSAGVTSLAQAQARFDFKDDPVAQAGALAGIRFDERTEGAGDFASVGEEAYFNQQRQAYIENAKEVARLNQATTEWRKTQTKSSSGAKASAKAVDQVSSAYDSLLASIDPVFAKNLEIAEAQETVNDAIKAGYVSVEEGADVMDRYRNSLEETNSMVEALGDGFDSIIDGLISGTGSWEDALKDVVVQLIQAQLQANILAQTDGQASTLGQWAATSLFGGGGSNSGTSGGWLGKIFAGMFDEGGTIGIGQTGIVGEYGPEIVTNTGTGATVTSRVDTAKMMGGAQPGAVEVIGGDLALSDNGEMMAKFSVVSSQQAQASGKAAYDATRRSLPGWLNQLERNGALA